MSREIKFRGYNGMEWIYGSAVQYDKHSDTWYMIENGAPDDDWVLVGKIGQYTGLKDSNGKDVYEGDIVLVTPFAGMDKSSYYGVFEFVPGGFQLKAPKERFPFGGGYVPFSNSMGLLCGIEVVGNIFEDPELLEGATH